MSYCSICCGSEICRDDDVAVLEFGDLIKVWMVDDHDHDGGVLGFFPFVSGEFKKGIEKGCEVGVLAGIVMWEALLLKLCLAFEKGIGRAEQEKKLQSTTNTAQEEEDTTGRAQRTGLKKKTGALGLKKKKGLLKKKNRSRSVKNGWVHKTF